MYNYIRQRATFWFGIVCAILIVGTVKAGTILLMNIGLGAPSSGPPPATNCIEYDTNVCILYQSGSSNTILVQ